MVTSRSRSGSKLEASTKSAGKEVFFSGQAESQKGPKEDAQCHHREACWNLLERRIVVSCTLMYSFVATAQMRSQRSAVDPRTQQSKTVTSTSLLDTSVFLDAPSSHFLAGLKSCTWPAKSTIVSPRFLLLFLLYFFHVDQM